MLAGYKKLETLVLPGRIQRASAHACPGRPRAGRIPAAPCARSCTAGHGRRQKPESCQQLQITRYLDQEAQSRLTLRLEPFLGTKEPTRDPIPPDAGKKFTAKSIAKLLDGVPAANKRRALEAAYGARGRDLGRNAGSLLADLHGSPHARDVCGFFAATDGLHPAVLEFLSGRTRATRKHRRRVLDLLLPAALKERPGLVPDLLACGVLDWESKDDARDLLRMLGTVAESGAGSDLLVDALASALGGRQPGK